MPDHDHVHLTPHSLILMPFSTTDSFIDAFIVDSYYTELKFEEVCEGCSVWSNLPKLTETCPVGLLLSSTQWFEEVQCRQTSPNHYVGRFDHTEPPRTTVRKGEAGPQCRLEQVQGGSTAPNLLKTTVMQGVRPTVQV